MTSIKKRVLTLLVSLSMVATLSLSACGAGEQMQRAVDDVTNAVGQLIQGDVTGEVGKEYTTQWFTFTINSLSIEDSYDGHTAAEGNSLVVAHITETNISGVTQPFGTFDWFVDDSSLAEYIFPLDPFNNTMMPTSFDLADKETASYDVVIEYPSNLAEPFLMYIEVDEQGTTYTTFKVPVK